MMAKPARTPELIALSNVSVFNYIKQSPEGEVVVLVLTTSVG